MNWRPGCWRKSEWLSPYRRSSALNASRTYDAGPVLSKASASSCASMSSPEALSLVTQRRQASANTPVHAGGALVRNSLSAVAAAGDQISPRAAAAADATSASVFESRAVNAPTLARSRREPRAVMTPASGSPASLGRVSRRALTASSHVMRWRASVAECARSVFGSKSARAGTAYGPPMRASRQQA